MSRKVRGRFCSYPAEPLKHHCGGARPLRGLACILWLLLAPLMGCSDSSFESNQPTVLTLWHVYNGRTDSPMNALVDRFNQSVGHEKGIIINVTSISNSSDIHFSLVAAAKQHPGAGDLPDMFIAYPKTMFAIGPERLVDWKEHLPAELLGEFVPSFLAEGEIDGRLVILPVAKSSNALFVNAAIFDKFSRETGLAYEDLVTWEGLFRAAAAYRRWSGGKAFFKHNDWFLYSLLNTASLGGEFFKDRNVNFADHAFRKVWGQLAHSAISGEVCLLDGYATTAMMIGEAVCGIMSTAAILYFPETVTFPDNTTIPLQLRIFPVPYFQEGERLTIQRGGGLGLVRSTPEKERAAAVFAEWFTAAENNTPFAMEHGYFPVKTTAYQDFLGQGGRRPTTEKHQQLYGAVQKIHSEFQFYIPPFFDAYGEIEKNFLDVQAKLFKKYQGRLDSPASNPEAVIQEMWLEFESSCESVQK